MNSEQNFIKKKKNGKMFATAVSGLFSVIYLKKNISRPELLIE